MEVIYLRSLRISSPIEQSVDFTKAMIVIETDAIGFKSWIVELEGSLTLAHYLRLDRTVMQLTAEAEDGRIFHGSAFVKDFLPEGTSVQVVLRGTGTL